MNKFTTTIIGASLFAVAFSTYAADIDLDDMYHYENFSAYDVEQSGSPTKNVIVSLEDMYRFDDFTPYNQETRHQGSNKTAGASVFSSTEKPIHSTALYHTY